MNPNYWLLIFTVVVGILFSHGNRMIVATTNGVSASSSFDGIPSHDFPAFKLSKKLRKPTPPPSPPTPIRAPPYHRGVPGE